MNHRDTLHTGAQVGAGVLLSVLCGSVGLVLVLRLQEEPIAWGVALLLAGVSFGASFTWVLRTARLERETG